MEIDGEIDHAIMDYNKIMGVMNANNLKNIDDIKSHIIYLNSNSEELIRKYKLLRNLIIENRNKIHALKEVKAIYNGVALYTDEVNSNSFLIRSVGIDICRVVYLMGPRVDATDNLMNIYNNFFSYENTTKFHIKINFLYMCIDYNHPFKYHSNYFLSENIDNLFGMEYYGKFKDMKKIAYNFVSSNILPKKAEESKEKKDFY